MDMQYLEGWALSNKKECSGVTAQVRRRLAKRGQTQLSIGMTIEEEHIYKRDEKKSLSEQLAQRDLSLL